MRFRCYAKKHFFAKFTKNTTTFKTALCFTYFIFEFNMNMYLMSMTINEIKTVAVKFFIYFITKTKKKPNTPCKKSLTPQDFVTSLTLIMYVVDYDLFLQKKGMRKQSRAKSI